MQRSRRTPPRAERYMVAVSSSDTLAGHSAVRVEDLADRHLLHNPDEVPEWRDISLELRGLTISPRESFAFGPLHTLELQLAQVAAGAGIVIVPDTVAASIRSTSVVFLAVIGMPGPA